MFTSMKNLALLSLLILFFSSCEKADQLTQFDLSYTTEVTIPPALGINLPFDLLTPEMETNSEAEFAINDTRKDLVEEINLTELKMMITSPSDQRFDFLNEASVFINAEGLSELKIAEATNISDTVGNELDLTPVENDLSEYIKKDKFSLRVKVVTDKIVNEEVKIDVKSNFFVDAQIIL